MEVIFLPVGHTHIDVDQLFSCISRHLDKYGCMTWDDLIKVIISCYSSKEKGSSLEGATPQWMELSNMYAVREWLLPHMYGLHNLNEPSF